MSFTIYSKNGQKVAQKSSLESLPFEEIQTDYLEIKASLVASALEDENRLAILAHKRVVANLKSRLDYAESTNEQEDDSLRDFIPITELPPAKVLEINKLATDQAVDKFVEAYDIKNSWKWLGPQLMAYLAHYKLPELQDGLFLAADYLKLNVTSDRDLGIYRMIAKTPRGKLLADHTHPDHLQFCALVPLYLAAQKKFNSIPYKSWSVEGLQHIVDSDMYQAMTSPPMPPGVTSEELLAIRAAGLQYISRSKKTPGKLCSYNPATYHQLTNISNSAIGHLGRYAKAMVTQIWCAHPTNRHQYMVLDPWNWDNIPDPLISQDILAHRPTQHVQRSSDIPWDQ